MTGRRPQARKAKGRRPSQRAFLLTFLALMVTAAGGNALIAVMPAIGRDMGVSDTLIVSIFSLSALLWTVCSPYWASQSDRRGRKPMILLGLVGFTVSMLLFGLVVMFGMTGWAGPIALLAGMAVARAIYGLIGSAANPACQAYVADRTSPAERTNALALLASAFGLGTIIGPAMAPFFVLPVVGLAGPMLAFTLIGVGLTWAVWRWLPSGDAPVNAKGQRPTQASAPQPAVWRDARFTPFLSFGFVAGSAQAINIQVLGFHVIDALGQGPTEAQAFIGIAMFAGAAAGLIAQWGLIRILDLGPKELMRWGAALAAAGNLILVFSDGYYPVVIGFALLSLGFGFIRPGFTAGASIAGKSAEQGAIAGAITAINGACWLVAPVIGVALYEWLGAPAFALNVVVMILLLGVAFISPTLRSAGVEAVEPERPAPPTPV